MSLKSRANLFDLLPVEILIAHAQKDAAGILNSGQRESRVKQHIVLMSSLSNAELSFSVYFVSSCFLLYVSNVEIHGKIEFILNYRNESVV